MTDEEERRRRRRRRRKNKNKNKEQNERAPRNPGNGGNPNPPTETKPVRDKKPKDPNLKWRNPVTYDMFEEFPEVDESNSEAVADFVDNLRRNLQSRYSELVPKFTIKEVDQIPKDYARSERYNDDDFVPDFDDIISEQISEEAGDRKSPRMVPEDDFTEGTYYVFGSVIGEEFFEGIPVYREDGSITWDVKISIPDTIGVQDYSVQYESFSA